MHPHATEAIKQNPALVKKFANPAPANNTKAAVSTETEEQAKERQKKERSQKIQAEARAKKEEEAKGFQIEVSKLNFEPDIKNKTATSTVQYKQPVRNETVAQMPPAPKPVVVKTTKLVKKEKDPTTFIIESSKLDQEIEMKGPPKIPEKKPEEPKVVDMRTKKLQQLKKPEPKQFTIETIKMKYEGPDLNATAPYQGASQKEKVKPDPAMLAKTTKLEQRVKKQRDFTIETNGLEPIPEQV